MPQEYSGYFVPALFFGLVLYGLLRAVVAPVAVRRFYEKLGFSTRGKSLFDEPGLARSLLLNNLYADNVYSGEYRGQRIEQFAAFPVTRRKFTMSRVRRKRNQAVFTVTLLHSDKNLVPFCARPTTVSEALEYMLDNRNVTFLDDEHFANRLHVLAEDHNAVRRSLTPVVRQHLTASEAIGLECLSPDDTGQGSTLILKRPREPFDVSDKLQAELEVIVEINEALTPLHSAHRHTA